MTDAKQAIREGVWGLLEREGAVSQLGVTGHIPDFVGAETAAAKLAELDEWQAARVVKANPDRAQLPARALALLQGKRVYMAVPRLAAEKPFVLIDPALLPGSVAAAASHQGAIAIGRPVDLDEMEPVDLVLCGSVAVNAMGSRIGKGGGYSDLEVGMLVEHGLLGQETKLATTVHPLQILDRALPEEAHDFRVDLVATPEAIMRAPRWRRPLGIIWDRLDSATIATIPTLARRRPSSQADRG